MIDRGNRSQETKKVFKMTPTVNSFRRRMANFGLRKKQDLGTKSYFCHSWVIILLSHSFAKQCPTVKLFSKPKTKT